jgi:predicted nucleotidyltransferase
MTAHGIDLDSEAIRSFCAKWKIRELSVFGSILRDDFRPDSDIDFLADFEMNAGWDAFDHMDMEEELAKIVGRKVDLVGRSAIEASRNRFYKKEILSTAEPIRAKR